MENNIEEKNTDNTLKNADWQRYFRDIQAVVESFAAAKSKQEFLDKVVQLIQEKSRCKFVGIRALTEDGYIPYQSYVGFSREFWESENMIQIGQEECGCTRIIRGKMLPCDMPIINVNGSLCCNDTFAFGQSLSEEWQKMYRGACIMAGYRSLGVIPIREREEIVGVIHLADEKSGQLSPAVMEFVEVIAPLVGKILTMDKVEQLLKNIEDKKAVLESIVAGISKLAYIVDVDNYELIYISKATKLLYGDALLGCKCYQIFGKKFPCQDCFFTPPKYDVDHIRERYDEKYARYYLCESKNINWPDGRIVPAVFVTDISREREAEKAEDALKETLRKFQVFFVHSRDVMLFVDWTNGNIVEANPAATALYGYSREELLTKNVRDLRREKEEQLIREHMDAAFKEGIIFETVHRRKDGSTFPVEVNSWGEQVGKASLLFAVVRDITERKATQEALRKLNTELEQQVKERTFQLQEMNEALKAEVIERQETQELLRKLNVELELRVTERTAELQNANTILEAEIIERRLAEQSLRETQAILQAALDNCQAGIAVADAPDGAVRYLNQAGLLIMNNTEETIRVGNNDYVIGRGITEREQTLLTNREFPLMRSIYYGETYSGEFIVRRENNKELTIWANAAPIKDEAGVIKAGIIIFLDISERKKIEESLVKAKEEAERATIAKSNFLANMSHEIRTPMNGIIGMTEITLMTELQDEQREYLNVIKSSTMALLRVLNDILDYSKIEADKVELEENVFNIRTTTNEVMELFAIAAKQKGLRITLNIDERIPQTIIGDAVRVRQILSNLVGNGVKFTFQGEVALDVVLEEQYQDRVKLKFTITDTGIGISKEKLDKLFKRFSQVDDSYTKQFGGTGLGLAISKKLIEIMQGEVGVNSTEGVGSVFFFTAVFKLHQLPADKQPARTLYPVNLGKNAKTKTVLIAEDDMVSREMVKILLRKKSLQVVEAENGKEAIIAFQKNKVDMILMDVNMPYLDGYSATAIIRSQERGKKIHTPIIAMTAYALKGDREKCLQAGMDDYISKPININEFSDVINKWLAK